MSASSRVEDLTVHFYRVERCGYYARRKPEALCGELLELIPELHGWVSQKKKRIADTATYRPDAKGTYLASYCIDSHHYDPSADHLMTLWIETELTEDNNFASVSGTSLVGSPKVKKEPVGLGDIPGIPAYFWILPSHNLIATVRFRKQLMHVSDFRRYLRGYLESHYSGLAIKSTAINNHNIVGVKNQGDTSLGQLDVRVELKRVENNTDVQEIISRRSSIRRVIRKKSIILSNPKDRSILNFSRRLLGLEAATYPGDVDSSLRFKLEIEQRPSLEELKAMIEEFEVDDGWSDLGFAMSDTDQYIRWLSGSYSKEEISIAIVRKDDGMVSLPHLMTSLQERRTDLLGSLNRRTRTADEGPAEDESIERVNVVEDAVVLVTNDGWIKRLRPNELGSTSMREGDGALALVGGSTKENVILFTNKGTAYNLRIDEVPQSAGHGTLAHQLVKFKDGERVIAALGTDPRVMTEFGFSKPDLGPEYEEPYPHMIAVTKRGMALRFTLWPHKDPSTVRGRMFGRTRDGDEFITVFKVYAEEDVAALSRQGKLLVASTQEVSLLGGPGLGVVLIKLDDGDELVAATQSKLLIQVERLSGGPQNVSGSEFKAVARGGKGTALWKRGTVKRVVLPVPTEPNLGAKEDKAPSASGKA